jgi:valyl-tRNA synthetase
MEISKLYDPATVESKWYSYWLEHRFFNSTPDDREPYTVVIPPPNVTGVLHMGHMLNNTIQDVLVRKARMEGKNACWVPGVDHASIATEAKVVQRLRKKNIKKSDLSREDFLKHAWEWKNEHGGIILEQLKKLGASCDWDRESFTMDPDYSKSVIDTFIDLYDKGYIYRGKRMINWDPAAKTALSDEEVIHKEVNSKLYHVRYQIVGTEEFLTIATTRPETILGDTAICVNPKDERYTHLHGKKAIVPMVNREVPIITDEYVDMEFGTGCLKITPAHDTNDYDLGAKHNLETIDILNEDGTLSEAAGFYVGEDRFEVRKKIAADLKEAGSLVKEEPYQNKVGYSERTDVPIESRISLQWFVSMEELSKPALEHVMNDDVQFWPSKFKNSYRHWMENVKDWCISRQLWWGHQIPAYYYGDDENDFVIAATLEEAAAKATEKSGLPISKQSLRQDEDVLDTWFSSWLWPISVFNGFYSKEEIDYYYPTNDLVTAPEIMFFWVARMIIAGYEYRGEKPFKNVYYTGIVRDKQGRKMSKSLGNSPDPIELMKQYGADGVRAGMLFSSPAGNDLLFDESLCEQGRNFSNKIWNALRLVKSWEPEEREQPEAAKVALKWMDERIAEVMTELDDHYSKFRISDVLMTAYKFAWNDFCSWYLEAVKPAYGEQIDTETHQKVIGHFETVVKILHPLMPFITEEIWHLLRERKSPEESLVVASWPEARQADAEFLKGFNRSTEVITSVRNIRKQNSIPNKEKLKLEVRGEDSGEKKFHCLIEKLCNLESINEVSELPSQAFTFVMGGAEYGVPFEGSVDAGEQAEKIKEELDYTKGFLNSVRKKLANERFVNNAPEQVVANERKKEADAAAKIAVLEDQLKGMGAES